MAFFQELGLVVDLGQEIKASVVSSLVIAMILVHRLRPHAATSDAAASLSTTRF